MKVKIPIEIPIILPIHIKGKNAEKDIDTLLDRCSTYTVISPDDILDLGYEITASGIIFAPLIKVNPIEFLGFKRKNVDILIKDLTEIGIDSFKINPLKGTLEVEDDNVWRNTFLGW